MRNMSDRYTETDERKSYVRIGTGECIEYNKWKEGFVIRAAMFQVLLLLCIIFGVLSIILTALYLLGWR